MENNTVDGRVPNENQLTQPTGTARLQQSAPYRSPPAIPPALPNAEAGMGIALETAQKQGPTATHLDSARPGETLRQRSGPYTKKVHHSSRSLPRRPAKQHSWTVLTASTHHLNSRDPSEGPSGTQAGGLGWLSGGLLVAQTLLHRGNAPRERSGTERLKDFVPYQWLLQRLKKAAATGATENETNNPSKSATSSLPKDGQQSNSHTASSSGRCAYQPYSHFAEQAMCETSTSSVSRPSNQTQDEPMELGSEPSSETETAHDSASGNINRLVENAGFDRFHFDHDSKPSMCVSDSRLRCPAVEGMETESSILGSEGCEDTAETARLEEGETRERRRRFLSGPARLVDTRTGFAKVMAATTQRMRGKRLVEDVLKKNQPRDQLPKVPAKRRWKSF
ncbi:PREDICTED: uncharacterized protein LOC109485020 [Branchiostoma belcheri]|uniref:Uncharacterized protein LOC109485020 n=1 Tax=Branchiostoma belcheri TaxID=7741 RepID=A0A6P4ZRY8_BRABE|nr:PREDICTED: uncharacterized protein LOC109485020 [Branchiostoma belcheri]